MKELGQIAYEAYCNARSWKGFEGQSLPPWNEVKPEIKAAWNSAANAVAFGIGMEPAHRRDAEAPRPKTVCICGSSRFADVGAVVAWELEKQGIMAVGMNYLPQWYVAARHGITKGYVHHLGEIEKVQDALDILHFRKIEMADAVVVLNVDGYIGARTRIEIDKAKDMGKPIHYWESVKEIVLKAPGMTGNPQDEPVGPLLVAAALALELVSSFVCGRKAS